MQEQPDHFVVYGDVLGFRNLVLTHRTAQAETLTYRRQSARTMAASLEHGNPLQRRLRNFHLQLDHEVFERTWTSEVKVMVFSDSLFVATTDGSECMSFCQSLIEQCIRKEVPLRIGVGFGSFISNSFSFESTPQTKVIATQFLGTGVVFASDAEKSLKGMRIGLHPSAVEQLGATSSRTDRRLALPDSERKPECTHEWNFLHVGDSMTLGTTRNSREELIRQVRKMQGAGPLEDPSVTLHYERTVAAIERMRVQMHTDWLKPGGSR